MIFEDELFPWWIRIILNSPHVKSRYEILGAVEPRQELSECPGEGKCHGSLGWCDWCGNVKDMCDANEWPDRCDQHRRYPAKPKPIEPDPNQLSFPW